jgi:hypothetical protein
MAAGRARSPGPRCPTDTCKHAPLGHRAPNEIAGRSRTSLSVTGPKNSTHRTDFGREMIWALAEGTARSADSREGALAFIPEDRCGASAGEAGCHLSVCQTDLWGALCAFAPLRSSSLYEWCGLPSASTQSAAAAVEISSDARDRGRGPKPLPPLPLSAAAAAGPAADADPDADAGAQQRFGPCP